MTEKMKFTHFLLIGVARRLSGRADCKNLEYRIDIINVDEYQIVQLHPTILVFPNTKRRKQSDKSNVLRIVIDNDKRLREYVDSDYGVSQNTLKFHSHPFMPGTYKYVKPIFRNRRVWYSFRRYSNYED